MSCLDSVGLDNDEQGQPLLPLFSIKYADMPMMVS